MKENSKVNFIGIGAQKAGTTWIHNMLKYHPEVSFGRMKEINYFNDLGSYYNKKLYSNYDKGVEWYHNVAKIKNDKLNGDVSPDYLYDCYKSSKRIYQYNPNMKIIVTIRDPVERAYSQYLFASQRYYLGKSFEDVFFKNKEFKLRGMYYKQLKPYFDLFPKENIKIIKFEDIRDTPKKTLKEIEKFLGIKTFMPKNIGEKVNSTKTIRSKGLVRFISFIHRIKKTKLGKYMWKKNWFINLNSKISKFISLINVKEFKKPKMSDKTRKKLIPYFKEDIEYLEKITNINLEDWKS